MAVATLTCSVKESSLMVAAGLLHKPQLLADAICGKQVMLVSDTQVAARWLAGVEQRLRSDLPKDSVIDSWVMPVGEQYKNITQWQQLCTFLATKKHKRDTTLIALGGGVVTDLCGFAAASYLRGVRLLLCPTSLLAQVDAAVGGKNGVNSAQQKNMLGTFYDPYAIYCDPLCLQTLAITDFSSGLAEVIKIALACDANFLLWIERNRQAIMEQDIPVLTQLIKRATALKQQIVASDKQDWGVRRILNLGHTCGHALEQYGNYERWSHGQAVSLGLVFALRLSAFIYNTDNTIVQRIESLLKSFLLPTQWPDDVCMETLQETLLLDKKNMSSGLAWVLLPVVGRAEMVTVSTKRWQQFMAVN